MRDRVIAAVGDLYEVEDEIGRGGMAVVYRARDVRLRRLVAIKVLPPDFAFRPDVRQRFLREAETSAQLSHPNIVPIFSVDERAGMVFFVMGLVEGESLAAMLARQPRPPIDIVRRVLREVADALAYAHSRHVVHRDVKPDNILIERESGRAMVTDFGIARAAEADSRLTVTGVAIGTPAYMSPEQALGEREVDGRSDIYSLGVVGYQMLVGETPFKASNTPAMMMKHLGEAPRPIAERRSDAPSSMRFAVERALAKRPEDRWPDAITFRDALLEGARVDAPRPSQGVPPSSVPAAGAWPGMTAMPQPSWDANPQGALTPFPRYPALPPGWFLHRDTREAGRDALRAWKDARKDWKRQLRQQRHLARNEGVAVPSGFDQLPVEEKMRRVRGEIVRTVIMSGFFFAMNMATSPRFWWWIFPALGMSVGALRRLGGMWADGIHIGLIFRRRGEAPVTIGVVAGGNPGGAPRLAAGGPGGAAQASWIAADAAGLVPPDVLAGAHGDAVRRAAGDRAAIREVIGKLSDTDRSMLPDVEPTVQALMDRIVSLAQSLHRVDADVSPEALRHLDARIAAAEADGGGGADRERRLALLKRQRLTVQDLAKRRETLYAQLESAGLVLQTIKLDLLKLKSAGVQSAIDDVSSATQEARALSREIGHVLGAAEELRSL